MEKFDRSHHWEKIYRTREPDEVSWYQPDPVTSLQYLEEFAVPLDARIIDVGGGDSFFVDRLLERGYHNVTVLDISRAAIGRARKRLGDRADQVTWIVADAVNFQPSEQYDFWHDRAAFHFLTDEAEIGRYLKTARKHIVPDGVLVIGTFSEQGPDRCSGIRVRQYSEEGMTGRLRPHFAKVRCKRVDHETPSGSVQNFVFCSFRRTD